MDFFAPIHIKKLDPPVTYKDRLLLIGSCFTEHIGHFLSELKFNTLQNPHGILFDPVSVCNSLVSYIQQHRYREEDLFFHNDVWQSWQHHSRFSGTDRAAVVEKINASQQEAHQFLQQADWLIITLGSSFTYKLNQPVSQFKANPFRAGLENTVANCHKMPAQTFTRHLCTIEETITALDATIHQLFHFNKKLRIIFTISPVRHLRDGVVDNNRSKARLLEAVHHVVNKFERLYYFPAYELVVDVLRDYRFYDVDMAHPNYAATRFVLEHFTGSCMSDETATQLEEVRRIVTARKHRPLHADTNIHRKFLQNSYARTMELQQQMSWLNFEEELAYFSAVNGNASQA